MDPINKRGGSAFANADRGDGRVIDVIKGDHGQIFSKVGGGDMAGGTTTDDSNFHKILFQRKMAEFSRNTAILNF